MEKSYDFLYHITKLNYLESILTKGLLINSGNTGFVKKPLLGEYYKKYNLQPIFLTNDVDYVIENQLTPKFIKNCIILKINISNIEVEDEFKYLDKKWYLYYKNRGDYIKNKKGMLGKTFICRENIKPNLIEIIKNGKEL